MVKIIQEVPENIVLQARHILESKNYNTKIRVETVNLIVGMCAVCNGIPSKYIIDNQDTAIILTRYCEKDFKKYQKYNKNKSKRKRKVNKKRGKRRKSGFGGDMPIVGEYESDGNEIYYCPECSKGEYGMQKRLYSRLDYNESDKDLWLQCTKSCGKIFGINELQRQSKLESFTVPPQMPYEPRNMVVGLDNKRKKTPREKELKRLKERIEREEEPDIKRELRKGNIVTKILDSVY